LRGREGFFGGMRAFFPGGITVGRAGGVLQAGLEEEKRKDFHAEDTERKHRVHREEERFNAECAENAEFAEKSAEKKVNRGLGGRGVPFP